MNDEFLTQFRKPPRREFTDELYQRINKPMIKQSPSSQFLMRRTALAFGAFALLICATLLISPSARAFAGTQIRQIGAILLRADDGSLSEIAATAQPTIPAPPENTARTADDAAEATSLAGFKVMAPGYLPEGYSLQKAWSIDHRDSGVYVVTTYGERVDRHFLIMNQTLFADDASFEQRYAENETVTNVLIGPTKGVFISGRLMTHPDQTAATDGERSDLLPTNWLIWENNGITYTLFGDDVSQDEMVRMAKSLR